MKKRLKALISIILTLTLLMSSVIVLNANAAVYYDRTAAVNYAKNHWNDGVGLCAQFVSACISAGGISVSQNVCLNLWNTLKNYGTPYKLTSTNSSGNGNIKLSANTGKVEAGDPLFYVCETCGGTSGKSAFPHVVFCGGTDSSGYLTAYAHNSAWNNKKVWTQLNSSAHSGHTFSVYSIHINGTSGYTMSYNANGGTGTPATQTGATTYTISSDIPERFGYTFEGWTPNDEGWLYYAGSTITLTQNTILYAYWKNDLNYYDYGNGVVGAWDSDIIRYSGQDIYYKFVPQRSGYYIFSTWDTDEGLDTKGWLYDANGNELAYNDDGNRESTLIKKTDFRFIYNVTAGKTYYIKIRSWGGQTGDYMFFADADMDLIFNANGGSGAPATQVGELAYTIPSTIPTRSGYTFLGWSTNKNATSVQYVAGDYIELESDTTLYAVWQKNAPVTYTLSYNANGGSGAPVSQSGATSYTISGTQPTRSGYTFLGWSKSSSATTASYRAGDSITLTANTTLYAVWEKNAPVTYTLSYNANGGNGAPSSQSGAISYKISGTQPTRSGYTFLGWSKSSSATTASYKAGNSITLTANTTLYAVWEKNAPVTYILSYNANGGSSAPSSQSGATNYIVSNTQPTRSGYTFLGWSKSSSATTASYRAGDSITLTANTTLYAVWKRNTVSPTPDEPALGEFPEIKIKHTSTTAIKYGDTLVLQLEEINLPEGYAVAWFVTGSGFAASVSVDGSECYITSITNGTATFSAKIVDEEETPVANADGEEIFDEITLVSKAGFWQKLISFFKNLFGINRVIY